MAMVAEVISGIDLFALKWFFKQKQNILADVTPTIFFFRHAFHIKIFSYASFHLKSQKLGESKSLILVLLMFLRV